MSEVYSINTHRLDTAEPMVITGTALDIADYLILGRAEVRRDPDVFRRAWAVRVLETLASKLEGRTRAK
jgi:hypothetical protein